MTLGFAHTYSFEVNLSIKKYKQMNNYDKLKSILD